MKKNILLYYFLICILLISGISCSRNFEEINTNPNTSEKALPETMLAPALNETIVRNMFVAKDITHELMQVTVNTQTEIDRIFRYDIRRPVVETPWRDWYVQLTNFKEIYQFAEETAQPSYMAISLICQSWVYSLITDTYGDVPYSESNQAKEGNFMPVFDRQKDIYLDIFDKLEQANELFKLVAARNVSPNSDPVYGGDVTRWRKFGNSLYLRLLLRASGNPEVSADVIARIQEIVETNANNYPVFTSNAESAVFRWTGTAPYVSPFATFTNAEWGRPKACSFFVDHLDQSFDPCISRWLTMVQGMYLGIPSAYPMGTTPETQSLMADGLKSNPLTGNMMNYSELQFILAEAALKGWINTESPQSYYERAVTARVTLWGATMGDFLSGAMVKWNDELTETQKLEHILHQKYFALFYTDVQSWCEYRRTGYPVLPKGPSLVNDGVMPTRLYYPLTVQAANLANYNKAVAIQGPDNLKTQLWWQKR
ncbi:MAG TPA: SusD/RagB family nutrient-binding outer membrane lipoprotein [Niabella sp.]|nr:SusD/RagB family nutrient-binding outer membrane lipoprotein [Niabella sp.]